MNRKSPSEIRRIGLTVENVTPIDFRHARSNSEFSEYFDVLSFSELINEATELKHQLERNPHDLELQNKSQILYSQFIKRLKIVAPELASNLALQRRNSLEIMH